jgi:hypothetical protein
MPRPLEAEGPCNPAGDGYPISNEEYAEEIF